MDNRTKKLKVVHEEPVSLGELIHQQVRAAVEQAVHEELAVALGVWRVPISTTQSAETLSGWPIARFTSTMK